MNSDGNTVATALAPGFRFHPTDEELVSYYLKRKVAGRPLRVDAISELDLYKSEPWDLPARSRIRSRDMEWYFFSPLDKKYANRSRTSRTTGRGYWKTTGKDRAVKSGARVVGMKKTLVFHVGKAPKGQRTNWVMHEYRLEDEELVKAGVSRDGYVVCRIFQKNGAGPQNGAQYGAPLEEEWEEDDGEKRVKTDFGDSLFMQLQDSEHEDKVVDVEEESTIPPVGSSGGNNACKIIVENEGSSSSLTHKDDKDFINFIDHEVSMRELFGDQDSVGFGDIDLHETHENYEHPGDDYLELNDFADILDADLFSIKDSSACNNKVAQAPQNTTGLVQVPMVEDNNVGFPEQVQTQKPYRAPENSDDRLREKFYPVVDNCSSNNHKMYFDAPENPVGHVSSSTEMNEFLYSTISMPSKSDPLDELIIYFDATEDSLLNSNLGNLDFCNLDEVPFASKVKEDGSRLQETSQSGLYKNTPENCDHSCSKTVDTNVSGYHSSNGWDQTIRKQIVGMLGSISSPPALAAEYPTKSEKNFKLSSTHPSSSVHVSPAAIHLNGTLSFKHWTVQKNEEMHLLSRGYPRDIVICSSLETLVSLGKVNGGMLAVLMRSGFSLLFFTFLLLAVSYKKGLIIYGW